TPKDSLAPATADALATFGTTAVTIIGDETAVSAGVERELQRRGMETGRLAGADRYDTAAGVALSGESPGWGDGTAILASGEVFADALAAAPIPYGKHYGLLLTRREPLPPPTARAIDHERPF